VVKGSKTRRGVVYSECIVLNRQVCRYLALSGEVGEAAKLGCTCSDGILQTSGDGLLGWGREI
jgi:hypothetical protein